MTNSILNNIADLYSQNLRLLGICSKAVGWTDPEDHKLRFEKLCYLVENEEQPFTVNDLGCGFGALAKHLQDQRHTVTHYYGYDISSEMIEAARNVLPLDRCTLFNHGSLQSKADYTFAGGTFNVRGSVSNAKWQKFILKTLDEMNFFSNKGFSFNLLSTYVDWEESHLYYGDPAFFFDYCKSRLGCRVSLLHDYNLYEWTIVAFKS